MTKNTSSFLMVLGLVICSIYLVRLAFISLGKIFGFTINTINNIRLLGQIRHIPIKKRFNLILCVRQLGKALIIPPRFEGDLIIEKEKIIEDEEKQEVATAKIIEMGESVVPALTIMKNSKYLNDYTRKKIEDVIEAIE